MEIYIAASSKEITRAKRWMALATQAGFEVVSTWPATIEKVGDANPRTASDEQRCGWTNTDIAEVRKADLLWLLVSSTDVSFGACFEFGVAHERGIHTVASGDTKRSIFTSVADEFDDDTAAFAHICKVRDDMRRSGPRKPLTAPGMF